MTPFEKSVAEMRKAQNQYFKARTQDNLKRAKHYEAIVDKHIAALQTPKMDIWKNSLPRTQ